MTQVRRYAALQIGSVSLSSSYYLLFNKWRSGPSRVLYSDKTRRAFENTTDRVFSTFLECLGFFICFIGYRLKHAQNNKACHAFPNSDKTWVFDQSECVQDPIYIIILFICHHRKYPQSSIYKPLWILKQNAFRYPRLKLGSFLQKKVDTICNEDVADIISSCFNTSYLNRLRCWLNPYWTGTSVRDAKKKKKAEALATTPCSILSSQF